MYVSKSLLNVFSFLSFFQMDLKISDNNAFFLIKINTLVWLHLHAKSELTLVVYSRQQVSETERNYKGDTHGHFYDTRLDFNESFHLHIACS